MLSRSRFSDEWKSYMFVYFLPTYILSKVVENIHLVSLTGGGYSLAVRGFWPFLGRFFDGFRFSKSLSVHGFWVFCCGFTVILVLDRFYARFLGNFRFLKNN